WEDEAVRVAHERWPNSALPGELAQVLPSPRHFEQAAQLASPAGIRNLFVCRSDPAAHLAQIATSVKAGFDEVAVTHIGPYHDGFCRMYAEHVLPARGGRGGAR